MDLEELEPIDGGSYLQGPDATDELVHVVVRFDRETDALSVAVAREEEGLGKLSTSWAGEEAPGSEYGASLMQSEGDVMVFTAEVSVED